MAHRDIPGRAIEPRPPTRNARFGLAAVLVLIAACAGGGGTSGGTAGGGSPAAQYPSKNISIMAPAAPGGGWDSTARALQTVIKDAKLTNRNVEVFNVAGAGGTVGLAQFVEQKKGDPESLMVMGLVMLGAIKTNRSPVDLSKTTPIATLTTEYEAIAVKADSKYKTLQDLVAEFKANPKSIAWGGGSAGGTDHILVGLIAKAAGVNPSGINYIAHSGGGEALDAILSGAVAAGVSSVSEFTDQVAAGKMRLLAVSSDAKIDGVDAPTIKEAGLNVVLANWRGMMAPPDLSTAQRDAIIGLVDKIHDSEQWKKTLTDKKWTDFYKKGDEYKSFLAEEQSKVEAILKDIGLTQ